MPSNDSTYLSVISLIMFSAIVISSAQTQNHTHYGNRRRIVWCTVSNAEQAKCLNFAQANERDLIRVGFDAFRVECHRGTHKDECMALLDQEQATLTSLDAAAVFVGGRHHSLVPIAQEILAGGFNYYYAVAVVKKATLPDVTSLYHLRNKKACFAGVETLAGWVLPINTLMKEGGMQIVDCNNHVKTASAYFGSSCAVNCLTDKYNPIGDNSDRLCQLCIGKIPGGRCTESDPYAGFEGAFRCLLEAGDVAFVRHNTVPDMIGNMDYAGLSTESFELLCKDGSRRPIGDHLACNWGKVPSDAVVTSSAVSLEDRAKFQKFLQKAAQLYPKRNQNDARQNDNRPPVDQFGNPDYRNIPNNRFRRQNQYDPNQYNPYGDPFNSDRDNKYQDPYGNADDRNNRNNNNNNAFSRDPYTLNKDQYGENVDPYNSNPRFNTENSPSSFNQNYSGGVDGAGQFYEVFSLFESTPRYGLQGNLMFQDSARELAPIPESLQTYTAFLAGDALQTIMGIRECPVNRMTLCVTSDPEMDKCVKMRTALKAQLLQPSLDCLKAHSQIKCMQAIRQGRADIAVLDAGDVYTAGLVYDLVPFISEMYDLDRPEYYAVAVAKESDPSTELTYLRGKNTCHGGINTAAGWIYPMAFLISNGWVRSYGCDGVRAAAECFTKSCVPGALSTEYNTGVPYDNLCDLCHGATYRYCRRDHSEDYYGHTGAFRCLVEGGGHVAFVRHTTVSENTGGKRRSEWWARDSLHDDYELACPDGTRAEVHEYARCNLGTIKANAIVTRGFDDNSELRINAYINLFMYAQTFYGRKFGDEFSFSMFTSAPPYADLIFSDATTQLKTIEPHERHYSAYLGADFMRARRIVDCHAGARTIHQNLGLVILSWIAIFYTIRY